MEPRAAAMLVGESNQILSKTKIQLGIFIGDCDSCTIQSARNAVDYEIVKRDDTNHTANTLTSQLYKNIKKFKELNSNSIKYLSKCFNYAVAQNKGDISKLADAIRNIPYHSFNMHRQCGDWCCYSEDPEAYKHSAIGEGFQDPYLFDYLLDIFDVMANKASSFAAGVSSNTNESFNAMVASKAPKAHLYGTSISYNTRVGLAVLKKNEGEQFLIQLLHNCNSSPTKKLRKYYANVDTYHKKRYTKANTTTFKRRRLLLKQQKSELRHKVELTEGTTYKSKAFLVDNITASIKVASIKESLEVIVVLFDLETGSLSGNCEILQIATKHEKYDFSTYIKPTKKISDKSSEVHGLILIDGCMRAHGKKVVAVTLPEALIGLYQFLFAFKKKCVLTAHNCAFDCPRLIKGVDKTFLTKYFQSIVFGFSDTLPIVRGMSNIKGAGHNKLQNIAARLKIEGYAAHDALDDIAILNEILTKLKITNDEMKNHAIQWSAEKDKIALTDKCQSNMKLYDELKTCTSVQMRKKMIACDISVDMIIDNYKQEGYDGLSRLLGRDENGKVRVTNNKNVIYKIINYLKSKY
ncbi:uncharacterized protein LOC131670209 [Phymastichus coffea]|uniref:uncharacterized protein LOC131670209 n=1 Tax=Phymastichus coffea TaxID=108790 RepID=UPI00273CB72E|nr:uncharacterized protein LOC131670209 [Phymastichus coffea]